MEKTNKISIFVGHFGSGKTETAINYAIKTAKSGIKTTLVDIDIVNPFFRSVEVEDVLNKYNVNVIAPNCAKTTMDIPSLPASIQSVFCGEEKAAIFDVGGDEDGARVLGTYKQYLDQADYDIFFVINTRRPFTSNADDIIEIMREVENKSRQKITHLVSNSNLAYETTLDIIKEGIDIVEEVSKRTNIPIAYINIPSNIDADLGEKYNAKKFIIDLYMTNNF